MKNSESKLDESVEQPPQQHTRLERCPHCGRRGLPERIAAHECQYPTPLGRLTILEHADSTLQTPETIPVDQLTIEWKPTNGSTRTLSFEPTATGYNRIESTNTATTWRAVETKSLPLSLTLTPTRSTPQEASHE